MSLGYAPGANSPRAAIRRNRHRSLSSSGSSKSGPIASGSSSGFGSSRRATGRSVRGSGATQLKRSANRSYPGGGSIVWSSPARCSSAKQTVTGCRLSRLVLRRAVRLAGARGGLEAGHVLGPDERQQRAGLARVEEPVRPDRHLAVRAVERDGVDAVAARVGAHGAVAQQQLQAPARERGREHRQEHGERHARLVAQPRHGARARVELRRQPRGVGQRVVDAVVRADPVAQRAVGRRAAAALDPAVLVGRHGLAGQLPAEPVGRLRQQHERPRPAAARAAATPPRPPPTTRMSHRRSGTGLYRDARQC